MQCLLRLNFSRTARNRNQHADFLGLLVRGRHSCRSLLKWRKRLLYSELHTERTEGWVASIMSRRGRMKTRRAPERSAFLSVPIGWDMAKSRRFSKSKSVCAGWSGKGSRLCAIWTPQCGGMKGNCVLSSAKVGI